MRLGLDRLLSVLALLVAMSAAPRFVHAQAVGSVCKDGTTSTAKGRGACGKHGGVDPAATKAARTAARAAQQSARTAARTVTCADGSTATSGRGACSHHGGVQGSASARVETKTDAKDSARADDRREASARASTRATTRTSVAGSGRKEDTDPTDAIAQCKDGLYSHATNRRGACSRHGGVKQWLKS